MSQELAIPASRRWIDFASKNAAGLTLGATILSLGVNYFLFIHWGMNYSLVVTTSDVLVGGLEAFVILLPVGLVIWLGFLIGQAATSYLRNVTVRLLIATLLSTPLILIVNSGIRTELFQGAGANTQWGIAFFASVMAGHVGLGLAWQEIKVGTFSKVMLTFYYFSIALNIIFFSAENRSNNVTLIGGDRCKNDEYVVWSGSYSLVTSCDRAPYDSARDYYIVEREGAVLHKKISEPKVNR